MSTASIPPGVPGLYFEATQRPVPPAQVRTDIAGFVARTTRGPVGVAMRLEGWREYTEQFGEFSDNADSPLAIHGYFENGSFQDGGDPAVAYVARVVGPDASTASAIWDLTQTQGGVFAPESAGFETTQFRIEAVDPGEWANGARVGAIFRRVATTAGAAASQVVDLTVLVQGEAVEKLTAVPTAPQHIGDDVTGFADRVNAQSQFIRLVPVGIPLKCKAAAGPRVATWQKITLAGGATGIPTRREYLDCIDLLNDVDDVALMAMPDLYRDITDDDTRVDVLKTAINQAETLHDRLVLVDLPFNNTPTSTNAPVTGHQADQLITWINSMRVTDPMLVDINPDYANAPVAFRAAAAYHPWLRVADPSNSDSGRLRTLPPSGHVAGVISWLDRQRGPHHTPANSELIDAVDLDASFVPVDQAALNRQGINLLRAFPNRGLQVWGGRTVDPDPSYRFIAHRRLIHLLVRAARRAAAPLVFESNSPELWLALVRAVTTVLLDAYRAGALKGDTAADAFRVKCDDTTTTADQRDNGLVICEIAVAPAVPMEFIVIRVSLDGQGVLEVFE